MIVNRLFLFQVDNRLAPVRTRIKFLVVMERYKHFWKECLSTHNLCVLSCSTTKFWGRACNCKQRLFAWVSYSLQLVLMPRVEHGVYDVKRSL